MAQQISPVRLLLSPAPDQIDSAALYGMPVLLALSAASFVVAPLFMPESYSWLSNTTSESGAQGIAGAWMARLGSLSFGLAVLWLAASLRAVWASGAVWLHMAFGAFMTATAAFSHRPWSVGAPFDPMEDFLHSMAATAMGFAFALGVSLRLLQRGRHGAPKRVFDAVAIGAAIGIPLLMINLPDIGGLLQRAMFLVAYCWYGKEFLIIREKKRKSDQEKY